MSAKGECPAVLWHGPGHQSRTRCHKKGDHEVHEAYYAPNGSHDVMARWRGKELSLDTSSGYFDEPPDVDEEETTP